METKGVKMLLAKMLSQNMLLQLSFYNSSNFCDSQVCRLHQRHVSYIRNQSEPQCNLAGMNPVQNHKLFRCPTKGQSKRRFGKLHVQQLADVRIPVSKAFTS